MSSKYTVETIRPDLVLISGSVPLSQLANLYNSFPKNYVQSLRFDVLLPGVNVVGSPEAVDDYFHELSTGPVGQQAMLGIMRYPEMTEELALWHISGETGASSKAMVCLVTGYGKPFNHDPRQAATPHDLHDLRRCILLAEKVPQIHAGMDKVAASGPVWNALVDSWAALVHSLDTELPEWRTAKNLSVCKQSRALLDKVLQNGRAADQKAKKTHGQADNEAEH